MHSYFIILYIHVYYYAFFYFIVLLYVWASVMLMFDEPSQTSDRFSIWRPISQTDNSLLIFTLSVLVTSLIGTELTLDLCRVRQTKTTRIFTSNSSEQHIQFINTQTHSLNIHVCRVNLMLF